MSRIYFISGPCGCGKTTFSDVYARHLVRVNGRTLYLIHGDDFHQGFIEPEDKPEFFQDGQASDPVLWEDILRFNWDCIISTADRALQQGMDVVIDYVIETELPRILELAGKHHAALYYIVLTADEEEIERRIRARGDPDLIERALFLKRELEAMPENRGHLYNNTGKTPEDMIREIDPEQFAVRRDDTLSWYRENAEAFIEHTESVDMSAQYRPFLDLVPAGGQILDLGCGAGNAALYFSQAGYQVLAVDGCREMCEFTGRRAGCRTRHIRFEELDYTEAFDGVWACASLLHVRKAGLPGVLRLILRAVKPGGVFYASFKYGETEREKNGRFFSDFTEDSLRALLDETGGFRICRLWLTHDVRPDRADERWVNVLCLKD